MWSKRWQLRYIDCRGLTLKPVGVRVCIDCKREGWEAGARTIALKGGLDGPSPNDASPDCRLTRKSFEGVESASRIVDEEPEAVDATLTKLVDGTLCV